MRSDHPSIRNKFLRGGDDLSGKRPKAPFDHPESSSRTSLDVHDERKPGEDELQPSHEELAHFVIAGAVPHGQGKPFVQISAMDLARVRETNEDRGLGFGHLRDREPVSPALRRVGHEGSQLAVDTGGHGDGLELHDTVLVGQGLQGEPRHRRQVGGCSVDHLETGVEGFEVHVEPCRHAVVG